MYEVNFLSKLNKKDKTIKDNLFTACTKFQEASLLNKGGKFNLQKKSKLKKRRFINICRMGRYAYRPCILL